MRRVLLALCLLGVASTSVNSQPNSGIDPADVLPLVLNTSSCVGLEATLNQESVSKRYLHICEFVGQGQSHCSLLHSIAVSQVT